MYNRLSLYVQKISFFVVKIKKCFVVFCNGIKLTDRGFIKKSVSVPYLPIHIFSNENYVTVHG